MLYKNGQPLFRDEHVRFQEWPGPFVAHVSGEGFGELV